MVFQMKPSNVLQINRASQSRGTANDNLRIFIAAMPGTGNLGDDLISTLLVKQVEEKWPNAEIVVLSGPYRNHFGYSTSGRLRLLSDPRFLCRKGYWQNVRSIQDFIESTDLMLIGGGGLFQDSHSPFTVHRWLRYAFLSKRQFPVWAVGVGVGPLHLHFSRWYLKKMLNRLTVIQVRDQGSQAWLERLGFQGEVATDIVAGSEIGWTPFVRQILGSPTLGCSIRPWPGMNFLKVVDLITNICQTKHMRAFLFVFEYAEPRNCSEYLYAQKLARCLRDRGVQAKVFCYNKDSLEQFANAFASVTAAVAVRYHANILWQKLGIPVLPISYAPKVTRLYEEAGFSVVEIDSINSVDSNHFFHTIPMDADYRLPEADPSTLIRSPLPGQQILIRVIDLVHILFQIQRSLRSRVSHAAGSGQFFSSAR
jgi:polysaccharide pyruvyl transferase WcaK-like protein